jgi:UDP-glucose 4-epimerase
MRAVVLGGNGFIGSHLVDALCREGWHVTVYDRVEERYRPCRSDVDYVIGELGNRRLLESVLARVDIVFHLISTTIPQTSNESPVFDVRSNLVDTLALLEICAKNQVPKVVFLSSGGTVYGVPVRLPISEDHPTNPICSYGITKLAIEKYLYLFHHLHGLDYSVLRPANPYGERQNPMGAQGVITVFLGKIAQGLPVIVWGDGTVERDFFYVSDLVDACISAATTESAHKVFNIGSGQSYSINAVIESVTQTIAHPFRVIYTPARPFDVPKLVLDIRRARDELHWQPRVSLEEGLALTWEWTRSVYAGEGR